MSVSALLFNASSPLSSVVPAAGRAVPGPVPRRPRPGACPAATASPTRVFGEMCLRHLGPEGPRRRLASSSATGGRCCSPAWPSSSGSAVVWRAWRRRVWRKHAAQARWLQIVPPVTATPAATVGLWRLLATALPAPRRWALRPPRIVWEVEADPHGMRAGLWLPPGVNPTAVLRLLQRAWPGVARRTGPAAPQSAPAATATTLMVRPTQPDWLPLVEDTSTASSRHWESAPPDEDRLRAVFDGLASAGRTGGGLLQVHISRAPAHRMRMLRRATTHPERARKSRGAARAVGAARRRAARADPRRAQPGHARPVEQHPAAHRTGRPVHGGPGPAGARRNSPPPRTCSSRSTPPAPARPRPPPWPPPPTSPAGSGCCRRTSPAGACAEAPPRRRSGGCPRPG